MRQTLALLLFLFPALVFAVPPPKPHLKVVACPGLEYQCSGVDWKSEFRVPVFFDLLFPDGIPVREELLNLAVNGTKAEEFIDLTKKSIACGQATGSQSYSLKKEKKYFRFKYDSKCGGAERSFEALCQEFERLCTDLVP